MLEHKIELTIMEYRQSGVSGEHDAVDSKDGSLAVHQFAPEDGVPSDVADDACQ